MRNLVILYTFLPLVAFGMEPMDDSKILTGTKGSSLAAGSTATLSDLHTEVRDKMPASEGRAMVTAGPKKRSSIRRTAVVPRGPLDLTALRKELDAEGGSLSVMPVVAVPPSTNTAVSLTRTQPSTAAVDDFSGFPSSGLVRPPKWVKGLSISCQKPEARDSKTTQASKPVLSSGVVYPLQWRAELTKQ